MNLDGYVPLQNSTVLEETLFQNNFVAGINFDDSYSKLTALPNQLAYSIRFPAELRTASATANALYANWRTDLLFPLFQEGGPRSKDSDDGGIPPGYYREGFVHIQHAVSTAFIELITKTTNLPKIFLQRYPYPGYTDDVLLQGLEQFVSLIILLSFVYPCINTVKVYMHQIFLNFFFSKKKNIFLVHNNREGTTVKGSNENYGTSKLVTLVRLVYKITYFHDGLNNIDGHFT